MELRNEFIEPEKSVRMVPGPNGMSFQRNSYSKEQKQKDLKILRETTEENHESSINIENYKTYLRDADNGDVSFSSYLMVGSQEAPRITLKKCLVDHIQSKEQAKDVASFPIVSCRKSDASFELGPRPKPIESSFIGPAKSAIGNAMVESNSPYQYSYGQTQMGVSNGSSSFVRGLQKQKSTGKRVPVIGRQMSDSEISIFKAERYFSGQDEKKAETDESKSSENVQKLIDNPIGKIEAKRRGFLMVHDMLNNSHASRSKNPSFSSIDVSRGFRSMSFPGGTTPTTSSEASWNSHSGLLSKFARVSVTPPLHKLPTRDTKRATGKWSISSFGCKCPCSGKKSVEIDDTLIEARRAASAPNSLHSSRLNSPLGSTKYRCPDEMSPGKSRETHKSSVSFINGEPEKHVNATTGGIKLKAPVNPLSSVDNSQFKPDLEHTRTDAGKFGEVSNIISAPHAFVEKNCQRRIMGTSSSKEDVFSFPILQDNVPNSVNSNLESEEKMRPSLQVIAGSSFHGVPSDSMEEMPKSDLHSRLMLFSLDKTRKSFAFNSAGLSASKFDGEQSRKKEGGLKYHGNNVVDDGENNKHDAESDSSSDLFEIESLSTQGTGYPLYNRRKDSMEISHMDDISSIQSSYAPSEVPLNRPDNSFQFTSTEEAVTPSALSSCYEPSEASVDWSATTGDTMDKSSLGNFSSYYETLKMASKHSISGFKENTYRASNFNSRRSTGMLGCGCEKAVQVAETNSYPIIHTQQRRAACKRSYSVPPSRINIQAESRVADLNVSATFENRCTTSDLMTGKRSISQNRAGHY